MDTHTSPLTTELLIEACAALDVSVSTTQLSAWVRAGLIPAHLRRSHGRGRGQGVEWLWEAECLPRALIIGKTLREGDPSFRRAAFQLAALGYAPDAEWLRKILLEGLARVEQILVKRQGYLKSEQPTAQKRRRLRKHVARHASRLPYSVADNLLLTGEMLHGLARNEAPDPNGHIASLQTALSCSAMRERVAAADPATLLANYARADRRAGRATAIWDRFAALQIALVGHLDMVMGEETIMGYTRESAPYIYRLLYTFWYTAFPIGDEEQIAAQYRWFSGLVVPLRACADIEPPPSDPLQREEADK